MLEEHLLYDTPLFHDSVLLFLPWDQHLFFFHDVLGIFFGEGLAMLGRVVLLV